VIRSLDTTRSKKSTKKKKMIVPMKCLDRAIVQCEKVQCEKYLTFRNHDDIDQPVEVSLVKTVLSFMRSHFDSKEKQFYNIDDL